MFNVYSTEYDTIDTTWPSSFFQRKLEVIWLQSSTLETFKKTYKTVDKIFDYVLTLLHVIIKSENQMASGNVLRGKKNGKNGFFPHPQRWNKNKSVGIKRMCQVKCLARIESFTVFIEGLMSGI